MLRSYKKTLTTFLAFCLTFSVIPMASAWAEEEITADTPMPDIVTLQEQADAAASVYDEATQRIVDLQEEIDALDERIREIQTELPQARETSSEAARQYYRMVSISNPFLEMILGATSLTDFFAKVEYSTRVNQSFLDDITSLSRLNTELEESRARLEASMAAIEEEQTRAEEAMIDAQNTRDVAEETALKIAELTAAATAAEAEAAAAQAHTPEAPVTPSTPGGSNSAGVPETPSDKQAFVNLWAPRIDAYLAGSPLAGYGYAFASAAYDYNVDPRWSPAIACLESSKGRYCFYPYNAWGWGAVTWPNWETAIYAHIHGLSVGYGYTISEAAAQRYCPPNWQYWYSFVSEQMALI